MCKWKKKNVVGAWEWSVYFFDLFTNNDKNIHHNQSRKKKKKQKKYSNYCRFKIDSIIYNNNNSYQYLMAEQ